MGNHPDPDAVDRIVHGAFASHGFTYVDRNGDEQVDDEAIKSKVYDVMKDHVIEDRADLKGAITQHEMYQEVFPNGPGAMVETKSIEEEDARTKLSRKVWGFAGAGSSSFVQTRLGAEGSTLVCCQATVSRLLMDAKTGAPRPMMEIGRFLTDDAELIIEHSTLPNAKKLVKSAEAVAKHMQMVLHRHGELAPAVARQVGAAVNQARAALGPVSDPKAAAALASAKPDDSAA